MLASRTISSRADGSANLSLRGLSPRWLHAVPACHALFGSPLAQRSRPVFGRLSFAGATGSAGMVTVSYAYSDISEAMRLHKLMRQSVPALRQLLDDSAHLTGCDCCRQEVKAGEELCISYLDEEESQKMSTADRREKLLNDYRFRCTCVRCGED